MNTMLRQLLRDDSAVTYTEYVVVSLAVIFGALGLSRAILIALNRYLHRIYVVVTLPFP